VAGITASEARGLLIAAAEGDTPPVTRFRTMRDWLGVDLEARIAMYLAVYIEPHNVFDFLTDHEQRLFLLILAELIEV